MKNHILEALEQLGAAFPWQTVSIWTHRAPNGEYRFTAHIAEEDKLGLPDRWGHGKTPAEACREIEEHDERFPKPRDPLKAREIKIAELSEKIAQMQAVVIGLPPYRPNRELPAQFDEAIEITARDTAGDPVPLEVDGSSQTQ